MKTNKVATITKNVPSTKYNLVMTKMSRKKVKFEVTAKHQSEIEHVEQRNITLESKA